MSIPRSRPGSAPCDMTSREELSALGVGPIALVELQPGAVSGDDAAARLGILIGIDRSGTLPECDVDSFDVLLTTALDPPRPWIGIPAAQLDDTINVLVQKVDDAALAATTLAQVLRAGQHLEFSNALVLESLAYSTLLAGPEFRSWRDSHPIAERRVEAGECVTLGRQNDVLTVTLSRPQVHNAFSAQMRDELVSALHGAMLDDSLEQIVLQGEGASFCSGGDLNEFGTAPDPATAHAIRLQRSVALYVHCAGARLTARIHGACIGAGIEIPAAASRVIARPGMQCRLPELGMGLIPGAGGTVTIPRRIGRHRACYMMLSGAAVDCTTARAWGLIDAIESAS